jgi:hypothetical protein
MFQKEFHNFESLYKFIQIPCTVLNCHAVTRHIERNVGYLRFNATSTGNAGCFIMRFVMVFQMLLCGECYEKFYT